MKKKDKIQYISMGQKELVRAIHETESKLAQYRVNRYSKQSKNVREGRSMRTGIAIMKTILRQKEMHHE